jgi:Family of unknown function (DUF5372)
LGRSSSSKELGQTVEATVPQATEQPSLDDQHRDFDLRLVAHCRLLIVPGTTSSTDPINHPFHPQSGRQFELVCRRRHWSEDRVTYLDDDGQLRSISADLTEIDPPDEFRQVAAGSAACHPLDLLTLYELLEGLAPSGIT